VQQRICITARSAALKGCGISNPTPPQCQGEELFELFRGLVVNVHGLIDFCDWNCLLTYTMWLNMLYLPHYTEEELSLLEVYKEEMKLSLLESQYCAMSPYVQG